MAHFEHCCWCAYSKVNHFRPAFQNPPSCVEICDSLFLSCKPFDQSTVHLHNYVRPALSWLDRCNHLVHHWTGFKFRSSFFFGRSFHKYSVNSYNGLSCIKYFASVQKLKYLKPGALLFKYIRFNITFVIATVTKILVHSKGISSQIEQIESTTISYFHCGLPKAAFPSPVKTHCAIHGAIFFRGTRAFDPARSFSAAMLHGHTLCSHVGTSLASEAIPSRCMLQNIFVGFRFV